MWDLDQQVINYQAYIDSRDNYLDDGVSVYSMMSTKLKFDDQQVGKPHHRLRILLTRFNRENPN